MREEKCTIASRWLVIPGQPLTGHQQSPQVVQSDRAGQTSGCVAGRPCAPLLACARTLPARSATAWVTVLTPLDPRRYDPGTFRKK